MSTPTPPPTSALRSPSASAPPSPATPYRSSSVPALFFFFLLTRPPPSSTLSPPTPLSGSNPAVEVIAVDQFRRPARPAGRRDQRVELVLGHHRVDSLGARQAMILRQRLFVRRLGQRPF